MKDSNGVDRTAGADYNALSKGILAIDLAEHDERPSLRTSIKRFFVEYKAIFLRFGVFLKFARLDAMARKGSYCLSFFSVFLVVFLCIVMTSTLFNLPVVFLRLGESNEGQNDLFIIPEESSLSASSLNYSMVEELFPLSDRSRGYHAPRISLNAQVLNFRVCDGVQNFSQLWYDKLGVSCGKGCMDVHCTEPAVRQEVVSIDLYRENRMGFGSKWKAPFLRKGEIIMSKDAAAFANDAVVGDTILLAVDVTTRLQEVLKDLSGNQGNFFTIMPMKLVGIIPADRRKFRGESFVLMDFNSTLSVVAEGLSPEVSEEEKDILAKRDPRVCASSIHFNLNPSVRIDTYGISDFNTIRKRLSLWVSSIVVPLGFNQFILSTPILRFLATVRFFSMFVGLIVFIILTSLALLSFVLVYSLFRLSVETRVCEMGIQRMIGFSKRSLVLMLLVSVYAFAIPAWLLALIAGQIAYLFIRIILNNIIDVMLPVLIPGETIGWATLAGLLLPLVGAIIPLLSVFGHNLSDALNSSRGRNVGVIYKIIRNGGANSRSWSVFAIGCLFAAFGFLLFYFFPIGMLHMDLALLFYIFFGTLFGMLLGLVLLALNFERVLQTAISYMFFWERKAVFLSVQKCLAAHRRRNRETTMMYALSLGFILFITIAFTIQLRSFQKQIQREMGAEVVVSVETLSLKALSELALFVKWNLPEVSALTYASRRVVDRAPVREFLLSSPGRLRIAPSNAMYAIPSNFFEVLNNEFLTVDKYNKLSGMYSIAGALYAEGRNQMIISASEYENIHSESLQDPIVLVAVVTVNLVNATTRDLRFAMQPAAVLSAAPQVIMSAFSDRECDILVSFPVAARLTGIDFLSVYRITVGRISLRVPNVEDVEVVAQKMKAYMRNINANGFYVRDERETLEYLGIADSIIGFFFAFTQAMTLIICFFSLLSSMAVNVLESSKEIGIFRCIGMTKPQIYRIFMWEAFAVVISGSFLGIVVGLLVGYTMQVQNYLFTQLSLPFIFPYAQIVIIAAMAIGAACLASFTPVAYLMRLPSITSVLRRTA